MNTVSIKAGREKSLLRHHPWLFSGAIKDPPEAIPSGTLSLEGILAYPEEGDPTECVLVLAPHLHLPFVK